MSEAENKPTDGATVGADEPSFEHWREDCDSEPKRLSPFRRAVLELLCQIPEGKVSCYGDMAKALSCKSAQAIGGALKHNPFAPTVPCHRCVAAAGAIGGFSGVTGLGTKKIQRKIRLLRGEGVVFASVVTGTVAKSSFYRFTAADVAAAEGARSRHERLLKEAKKANKRSKAQAEAATKPAPSPPKRRAGAAADPAAGEAV